MNHNTLPIFTTKYWVDFWDSLSINTVNIALQCVGVLAVYVLVRLTIYKLLELSTRQFTRRIQTVEMKPEQIGRLQMMQGLAKSIIGYLLIFIFGTLFLKALGLDIMPFITTASIVGIAVGFGSQKLVKDMISGLFILVDDLFVVGDIVVISGMTGCVEELGLRVTRLRDLSGKVYVIPNGDIGTVTNLSRNPVQEFIEINIAANADLNETVSLINRKCEELMSVEEIGLKEVPSVVGVTAFSAASVTLRVSVQSAPEHLNAAQMRLRSELRETLLQANIALA